MAGESLDLTRREFELLQVLADHAGKVLERDEIYQRVWGYAMIHGDRSVDVFVRKLRSKLQQRSPGWDYIHTHFGIGYRFDPQPIVRRGRTSPPIEKVSAAAARGRRPHRRRRPRRPPGADAGLRRLGRTRARWPQSPISPLHGTRFTTCSQVGHTRGNRCRAVRWDAPRDNRPRRPSQVISRKSILAVACCGVLALGVAACGSSSSSSTSSIVRRPDHRRRQHVRRAADVEVAVRLLLEDRRHGHLRRDRLAAAGSSRSPRARSTSAPPTRR